MADHQEEAIPNLLLSDSIKLPTLFFLGISSWCLPPSRWPRLCGRLAGATQHIFPERRREEAGRLPPFLAAMMDLSVREAVQQSVAAAYQDYMYAIASYRPLPWRFELRLSGREHLEQALAAGRGAILWQTDLHHTHLMAKVVLASAGYRPTQLSHPEHGFSTSRFGRRYLNPIELKAENRYVRERVVLEGPPERAARLTKDRLAANGIVSITVGERSLQVVETALFGGTLRLATGPITLSRSSGAPLIPTFLVSHAPDSFELCLKSPLAVDGERPVAYRRVAETYGALLEENVRRYPQSWLGWRPGGNWHPEAAPD